MAGNIGVTSLRGLNQEDFSYTFNLASTITADDVGKAVTIDTGAANKVKLAGDGEVIIGILTNVEVRTAEGVYVGTVQTEGGHEFQVNPNATNSPDETPAIGDYLVGGTATDTTKGYVQKSASNAKTKWLTFQIYTRNSKNYVVALSV